MVKQHQATSFGPLGEFDRVPDTRVTPADPGRVLDLAELAVVKQQVDVVGERVAGDPLRFEVRELDTEDRLMVWDVRERRPVQRESVSERRSGWDTVCASI